MIDQKPEILQTVESKAEKLAFEIFNEWFENGQPSASKMLKQKCDDLKMVYWEASAVAQIASCMIHGKKWKKD